MNLVLFVGAFALLLSASLVCGLWARRKRTETRLMANAANAPGAGQHLSGMKTYRADAAITRFHLVKSGSDQDHVAVSAAATDKILGVATDECTTAEDLINIALLGAVQGTLKVVATGVIAVDAFVQSNGDGTVKTAVTTGYVVGKAVIASGATGDIIEIIPICAFAPLA